MLLTVDFILLVIALCLTVWSLVRQAVPYLAVAVLLVIVDLLLHILPR